MPIYDHSGTTAAQIGKLYDHNGTTATQIGKVYDNNGTTNTLIYSSETVLFQNGATADSGAWTGYSAYGGSAPTIGTTISYPTQNHSAWIGSLASCATPIKLSGSHTLSFAMTQAKAGLQTTNIGIGKKWGLRIYALFSTSRITLDSATTDVITWAESHSKYSKVCDSYVVYQGDNSQTSIITAGTKTTSLNISGSYYFGLLLAGYDASVTSAFTVNNIIIT